MPINQTETSRTSRIYIFLIIGAGTLFLLIPVLLLGMPARRDFAEHLHLARTSYYAILSGNFIPSWPGDVNGGVCDPAARFYPPALAFTPAATATFFKSWVWGACSFFYGISVFEGVG